MTSIPDETVGRSPAHAAGHRQNLASCPELFQHSLRKAPVELPSCAAEEHGRQRPGDLALTVQIVSS